MPRLIYLANARLPTEKAHGVQIMWSCAAFAAAGFEVTLVVPTRTNPITTDAYEYYGVPRTFTIERLRIRDLMHLGMVGFVLNEWQYVRAVAARVRRWKGASDTILYGRDAEALAAATRAAGLPAFFEVHDLGRRLLRSIRRHAKVFTGYVTTNGWKRDRLAREFGIPPDGIFVAQNGVDLEPFEKPIDIAAVRKEYGIDPTSKIVAYSGRFYQWKGVQTLIRAAAYLPQNIRVLCIGGSEESAQRLAPEADCSRVQFIPQVSHARIPDLLRAVDVLVLPNSASTQESSVETSPIKLFEYLASGTPIIASDLPSIREVIDERVARFVPPDAPEALAKAITDMLDDANAEARADEGRVLAKQFTWIRRAERITEWMKMRVTKTV